MTLINCVSTAIYTKGQPLKQKLQPYILALIFLVILYHSPSGLVIYWTMNNIFSLGKNIVMRHVKKPGLFLSLLAVLIDIIFVARLAGGGFISNAINNHDHESVLYYAIIALVLLYPMLSHFIKKHVNIKHKNNISNYKGLVFIEEAVLLILLGFCIPVSVIHSSPLEFMNPYFYKNPLYFVYTTFFVMFGLVFFWGNVIYFMANEKGRAVFTHILYCIDLCAIADYMFFKAPNVESLTVTLRCLPSWPRYETTARAINLLLLIVLILAALFLLRKNINLSRAFMFLLFPVLLIPSAVQFTSCVKQISEVDIDEQLNNEDRSFVLSRNGQNVVYIMLDRAIGALLPYVFDQYPEIKAQYSGFTFYPNTASFGRVTRYGSPPLFGGYDYTPSKMNERSGELLSDKHDEALSVLPAIFNEEDWQVTVCDVPFAGYKNISDLSIYNEYENVNAFHLAGSLNAGYSWEETWKLMERTFAIYSIYKAAPAMLQDEIYDMGDYLKADSMMETDTRSSFADDRAALEYLRDESVIIDDNSNTFLMMDNDMAHDPVELQLPDYVQKRNVDNSGYDTGLPRTLDGRTMTEGNEEGGLIHYQTNVLMLKILGQWFDRMREEGVYDNTRIILVADHGWAVGQFDDMLFSNGVDAEAVNPLLLYKDFNSSGFTVDESFMTNADAPALALSQLIADPVNPFTGNKIDQSGKEGGIDLVYSNNFTLTKDTVFNSSKEPWYHVKDNIFKEENWTRIESR